MDGKAVVFEFFYSIVREVRDEVSWSYHCIVLTLFFYIFIEQKLMFSLRVAKVQSWLKSHTPYLCVVFISALPPPPLSSHLRWSQNHRNIIFVNRKSSMYWYFNPLFVKCIFKVLAQFSTVRIILFIIIFTNMFR